MTWQDLYEKYQRELLEQSEIIAKLRADVAFWHDAHARVDAQRVKAEGRARQATEIVQAVATTFAADGYGRCAYCKVEPATGHRDECPVVMALAWLASE